MLLQLLGWIKMIMVAVSSHRCHSVNAIRGVNVLLVQGLLLLGKPTSVWQYLLVLQKAMRLHVLLLRND